MLFRSDSLFAASRDGWAPVDRTGRGPVEPPATTSAEIFSEACADLWVARGELCEEVADEMKGVGREAVDVLYTYTNGTDRLLRTWRESLALRPRRESRALVKRVRGRPGAERPRMQVAPKGLNHFRYDFFLHPGTLDRNLEPTETTTSCDSRCDPSSRRSRQRRCARSTS